MGGRRGGGYELWQESLIPNPRLCPPHTAARFQVNINGFLKRQQDDRLQFTVGNEVRGPGQRAQRKAWVKDSGPGL